MIERDHIRVVEKTDDPGLVTFGESELPILSWIGGHGWDLSYLDAHGEPNDHRIAGSRDDVEFAVAQARDFLDGAHSDMFPTEA